MNTSNENVIDEFFYTYQDYWRKEYSLDPAEEHLAEQDELEAISDLSLREALISGEIIEQFQEALGTSLPNYYAYFLTRFSYRRLDTPLVSFPSTATFGELREMHSRCSGHDLIPFGHDLDSSGVFCIDQRNNGRIVHWPYSSEATWDRNALCSSFPDMLRILATIIRSPLRWYGQASTERQELTDGLRLIDPTVFGDQSWEWWEPRLVQVSV